MKGVGRRAPRQGAEGGEKLVKLGVFPPLTSAQTSHAPLGLPQPGALTDKECPGTQREGVGPGEGRAGGQAGRSEEHQESSLPCPLPGPWPCSLVLDWWPSLAGNRSPLNRARVTARHAVASCGGAVGTQPWAAGFPSRPAPNLPTLCSPSARMNPNPQTAPPGRIVRLF